MKIPWRMLCLVLLIQALRWTRTIIESLARFSQLPVSQFRFSFGFHYHFPLPSMETNEYFRLFMFSMDNPHLLFTWSKINVLWIHHSYMFVYIFGSLMDDDNNATSRYSFASYTNDTIERSIISWCGYVPIECLVIDW